MLIVTALLSLFQPVYVNIKQQKINHFNGSILGINKCYTAGHSYGGGVLTFEPNEAERLSLPLAGVENLDLDVIDERVRKDDIDAVLDVTDRKLLMNGLGLSKVDAKMLRGIWEKLRDRRIKRKHRRRKK